MMIPFNTFSLVKTPGNDCVENCDEALCADCVGQDDTPIEAIARGLIVSFG